MKQLIVQTTTALDANRRILNGLLDGEPEQFTYYPRFGVVITNMPEGIEIATESVGPDALPPLPLRLGNEYTEAKRRHCSPWPMVVGEGTNHRLGTQVEVTVRSTGGVWFRTYGWHRGLHTVVSIPYDLETPAQQAEYVAGLIEKLDLVPAYNLTGNEADLEQAAQDIKDFLVVYRASLAIREAVWVGQVLWIEFRIVSE